MRMRSQAHGKQPTADMNNRIPTGEYLTDIISYSCRSYAGHALTGLLRARQIAGVRILLAKSFSIAAAAVLSLCHTIKTLVCYQL